MKNNIKVSIITPSLNQGDFIECTIKAVLAQSYTNIEYIIVDGASSDKTKNIIDKYASKIDFIISEKDNGQSDAINKGFKLASGDLLGWVNSDDILYENSVEEVVKCFHRNSNVAIIYNSRNHKIDRNGKIIEDYRIRTLKREYLLNQNYSLIQQSSFYNAKYLKKVGYLDESVQYCMDLDLWLRLLCYSGIADIGENPLSALRIWEGTKTTTGQALFLRDIRRTLLKNGASSFSRNIIRTYLNEFKLSIKKYFQ